MSNDKIYDIIIIGAGTAGSVLANRLSANPNLSVLVLEAGKNRNKDPNIYTPGLGLNLLDNDDYDWRFNTEPEPGLNGRVIKHPRGKVVGGSSAINSFALIYPNRAGIDVLETMGNKGWNWNSLQPYFTEFQTVCEPVKEVREKLNLAHGKQTVEKTEGPLQASFPPGVSLLQKVWVDTWKNLGLETRSDAFEGEALGGHTSTCHISADRKERSHAGIAFLEPVSHRPNLTIITEALVEKLLFSLDDGQQPKATGVQYTLNNTRYTIHSRREIILSAGTFGSPALLELSGIGSQTLLSSLDIPVIYSNPAVGSNLQDHIRAGISFEATDDVFPRSSLSASEARRLYEEKREGPWAESACWAFAYMPLLPFLSPAEREDFESLLQDTDATSGFPAQKQEFIKAMLGSENEATATAYLARKPAIPETPDTRATNWITLFAMLAHPLSEGSVHITSASAAVKPRIQGGYYSHPLDLEVHARVLKGLFTLADTPPLSGYLKQGGKCTLDREAGLEDVKAYLRMTAGTNYHPVGTCAMLPEGSGGVVDEKLRVHGVRGLRVVDASVLPVVTRGNVITAVYALAERGAEMILESLE